ncbi:CDP-glucose 4,6-dehydratase [Beggiatoa alba B18LD]|uniref:CDP-glucose 4,6-dehydratase n=1 Tax=Beggiatoa alba B18LD TaxID=395493 RepID=I3CHM6_9GAMM|nr:CDP-glucose 4,6-dehydratase [Beggiatoa alba]EIJ43119.1 CDP-glucose 4,6-dehydratase [Beggiatoa alba B18LD]
MESLVNPAFWQHKKVLLTGHTGFKGSWLALWLQQLGADVIGYSLPPPTQPNLYELAHVAQQMQTTIGDIRDLTALTHCLQKYKPDIVFHLAAQSLVRYSYQNPVETYASNVMGTVHLLDAVRQTNSVKAVVIVTSDKCYDNQEWIWAYRENEPMGGYDPYSNSKGCAELVTMAYRNSFFHPANYAQHGVAIASVRAGNVIGGGDWAQDRLIPDILQAFIANRPVQIRNPHAIRPWQLVLEPLQGYLLLAEKLYLEGTKFAEGWNFGAEEKDSRPVQWIVEKLAQIWGSGATWQTDNLQHPHEAHYLKLDSTKAKTYLGWQPKLSLETSLTWIVEWYQHYLHQADMETITRAQIANYQKLS